LDLPNDDDPASGYYKVIVVWKYFIVNVVLLRMVMVGTSRSLVATYIVRAPKQKNFFGMMEEWYKNIAPWRKCKLSEIFSFCGWHAKIEINRESCKGIPAAHGQVTFV
jgi:hypothetical protein